MENYLSIIFAIFAIIINSAIFGSVARNSKNNNTNKAYLIFLSFIILYTIFDCIIIQAFDLQEQKDVIIRLQAMFWMPLSILFLNFTYSLLTKKRDNIFYFFVVSITLSILITLFSNKVLLSYKDFNFGTMAYTGTWFLATTFLGIVPAAIYSLYLIGKEANIFYSNNKYNKNTAPFVSLQLKILFFGSTICLIIAVTTNIFFDEVLGYSGELHLASLSLSIQSIFLLPAIIKYNFLNQPMETLGDELYLNSSDAVLITSEKGLIINLNKASRILFNLKGPVVDKNINELFYTKLNFFSKKKNIEAKTITNHYVTVAQNSIARGNFILGNIITIRDITESKKIEYELQESEKRYRLLVENSTEMIYKTDLNGNYTYVNQVFIEKSGITEAENLKTNCFDRVVEKYRNEAKSFYKAQLNNKEPISYYELPCYVAENKFIWVGQFARLELNESGDPIGHAVTARDITERKETEKNLLHLTKELTNAQEVAGLGSFSFDIKNKKVTWSDKLYKIYGREKKLFNPTRDSFFNEIVHPESRQTAIEEVENAVKNKQENLDYVHKALMPNGEEKWFHAIIKINYNKKGDAVMMHGTSQDVTELHSSRHLLEVSELRLKMALEIAQVGRWEENHKTGEMYWSSKLRKMFNIEEKTTINQNVFWRLVHPEDLKWMKENWLKAEKEKASYSGTFRIKLKNGQTKHLMEHAEFIINTKGKLEKTVGTVIDMTKLHKNQEELRQLSFHIQEVQEEERGRIAREIHDALGQRLTSITMDLEFLNNKLDKNTPEEIKERLIALMALTDETIKITRKISQELRPTILDDLGLISAIDWLKEQYNKRTDIHFKMDMPKEDIDIKDEYATAVFRITQEALTNIIRHAEAKNVEIQVKLVNSKISLKVRDDGKGIKKKNIDKKEKTFGVFGMKERAAMLGGEMKIESQPNKGTTINVSLPI